MSPRRRADTINFLLSTQRSGSSDLRMKIAAMKISLELNAFDNDTFAVAIAEHPYEVFESIAENSDLLSDEQVLMCWNELLKTRKECGSDYNRHFRRLQRLFFLHLNDESFSTAWRSLVTFGNSITDSQDKSDVLSLAMEALSYRTSPEQALEGWGILMDLARSEESNWELMRTFLGQMNSEKRQECLVRMLKSLKSAIKDTDLIYTCNNQLVIPLENAIEFELTVPVNLLTSIISDASKPATRDVVFDLMGLIVPLLSDTAVRFVCSEFMSNTNDNSGNPCLFRAAEAVATSLSPEQAEKLYKLFIIKAGSSYIGLINPDAIKACIRLSNVIGPKEYLPIAELAVERIEAIETDAMQLRRDSRKGNLEQGIIELVSVAHFPVELQQRILRTLTKHNSFRSFENDALDEEVRRQAARAIGVVWLSIPHELRNSHFQELLRRITSEDRFDIESALRIGEELVQFFSDEQIAILLDHLMSAARESESKTVDESPLFKKILSLMADLAIRSNDERFELVFATAMGSRFGNDRVFEQLTPRLFGSMAEQVVRKYFEIFEAHTWTGYEAVITTLANQLSQDQISGFVTRLRKRIGDKTCIDRERVIPMLRCFSWQLTAKERREISAQLLDVLPEIEVSGMADCINTVLCVVKPLPETEREEVCLKTIHTVTLRNFSSNAMLQRFFHAAGDVEILLDELRQVTIQIRHARPLAKLLQYPGCIQFSVSILLGLNEILFHGGKAVHNDTPEIMQRIKSIYDAAEWIEKNWPDFDLEATPQVTYRPTRN